MNAGDQHEGDKDQMMFLLQFPLGFFFFFLRLCCTAAFEILVPPPETEPTPPAVEMQSLNHWHQGSPSSGLRHDVSRFL